LNELVWITLPQLLQGYGQNKFDKEEPINHKDALPVGLNTLTSHEYGVITTLQEIGAVGHRVVHGGEEFTGSVLITEEVIEALERNKNLAPLHNPPNLTGIYATKAVLPEVPMVGVFDTAFHATMPERAYLYALPIELYEKYKVRRYGSMEQVTATLPWKLQEGLVKLYLSYVLLVPT